MPRNSFEGDMFQLFVTTAPTGLGNSGDYGWDEYPGTRGSGRVNQLPGHKFTTSYPNANYRIRK